ncbi:hypothetical protein GK047_27790 [Paenibacillus sp. SYP-B3998]|uniref:CdiI immunity protein domain-containing protein n=1 Tax=Paenibacillus sp. SYP-B3998 TaxID=2678564 RepID=A0A6G4A7F0_9BACL|nr:contact-dependent growth inhibition system immunity protein [Paenibacillus sp. SYP-B3998]NEW09729.1 hypothetical protein [Paenibacillus sp. SYP-B3998]
MVNFDNFQDHNVLEDLDSECKLILFFGNFHQDMGSVEEALGSYLNKQSEKWIKITYDCCIEFLNDHTKTQTDKELFVMDNTQIYFHYIEMTPLEWIEYVTHRIEERLK